MPIIHDQAFRAWEACVPQSLRDDPSWKFHAYRVALYMLDLAKADAGALRARQCAAFQIDQLSRAVASVAANVAEGFGRASAVDRSRCFGIALGSLKESVVWYRAVAGDMAEDLVEERLEQLSELRRILIGAQKWLATKPARSRLY